MKKRGIAYRRMIVSFAMIFVLPLTLVLAFYLYSYRVIERQIEASNDNFVHTIQNACDRELQFYQNTLTQLSMNEYIENLADLDVLTSQGRIDATELVTNIYEVRTTISLLGNECEDVFVYFPKLDMFFSHKEKGSTRLYTYAKVNYSEDMQNIVAMVDQLQELDLGDITDVINTERKNAMRDDVVGESGDKAAILANAPSVECGGVSVPRVVE